MISRSARTSVVLLLILFLCGTCAINRPQQTSSASAALIFDSYAEILQKFVGDTGLVDYGGLKNDRENLKKLLIKFSNLEPQEYQLWPKEDKIAFWINIYNLHKLYIVAENYPIKPSTQNRILWYGPNDIRYIERRISEYEFIVLDRELTFRQVEKEFFSGFDEPRIFLAITDACLSSPPLRQEPYYGKELNEQLDGQTKRFLSEHIGFDIDRVEQVVYLSAIFEPSRFGEQFIENYVFERGFGNHAPAINAVLNFISNYVSGQDALFLEHGGYSIRYMKYDWTINDS